MSLVWIAWGGRLRGDSQPPLTSTQFRLAATSRRTRPGQVVSGWPSRANPPLLAIAYACALPGVYEKRSRSYQDAPAETHERDAMTTRVGILLIALAAVAVSDALAQPTTTVTPTNSTTSTSFPERCAALMVGPSGPQCGSPDAASPIPTKRCPPGYSCQPWDSWVCRCRKE